MRQRVLLLVALMTGLVLVVGAIDGPRPTGPLSSPETGPLAPQLTPAITVPVIPPATAPGRLPVMPPVGQPNSPASSIPSPRPVQSTNPQPAGPWTPPVSKELRAASAFYHMRFLPDGFPGMSIAGKVTPQPIYGTYVLNDLLTQQSRTPAARTQQAIARFAHVAVSRMRSFRGALVFWIPAALGFARDRAGPTYSGLDMAYYAVDLFEAWLATGDPALQTAADASFRSLLVPEELGGVLYSWGTDVAIAEVPSRPRDLTLNGWLSILVSIHRYAELSGSTEATRLFAESLATLGRLLPLYDAAAAANSRYDLSGRLAARLVAADPTALTISNVRLVIPQEGSFPARVSTAAGWWTRVEANDVLPQGDRLRPRGTTVRLDLQMSRLSFPSPNVLELTAATTRTQSLLLQVLVKPYDPHPSGGPPTQWRDAGEIPLPAGETAVTLPIPWSLADAVGTPTRFDHEMQGRPVNIYNLIHVSRLDELYSLTGMTQLREFADRWRLDVCSWGQDARYAGLAVASGREALSPQEFCRITGWDRESTVAGMGRRLV